MYKVDSGHSKGVFFLIYGVFLFFFGGGGHDFGRPGKIPREGDAALKILQR